MRVIPLLLGLLLSKAALAQPEASPTPAPEDPSPPVRRKMTVQDRSPFSGTTQAVFYTGEEEEDGFGLGSILPDPTAFQGANRNDPLLPDARFIDNLSLSAHYAHYFSPNQRLMLTGGVGTSMLGGDLDYSFIPEGMDGFFSAYVNQTRSWTGSYLWGRGVGLPPDNDEPWVYKTNVGFGYTTDPRQELCVSTALVYEQDDIHSGFFTGRVRPFDSLGNPLTLNPGGTDRRLLARVNAMHLDLDDIQYPSEGGKLLAFADAGIGLSPNTPGMSRMGLSYSRFIPIGAPTLVLNVQGGTILGTAAPYDAFNLGGPSSIRGYNVGEVGGGTSFVQGSAELRVPLGQVHLFHEDIPLRFAAFVDYGSALGTAGRVYGQPAVVREKLDSAVGYGVGLQAITNFGLMRLEAGFGQDARSQVLFSIGDRF